MIPVVVRRLLSGLGALALGLSLVGTVGPAHADETPDPPPRAGFGSISEPMTTDHGSIDLLGIWLPVFRFFNPCAARPDARGPGQRIFAVVESDPGRFAAWQLAKPGGNTDVRELTLKCATVSVGAWAQGSVPVPCPVITREIPPYAPSKFRTDVGRSRAFHHGFGPILIPGYSAGGSGNPPSISFTNMGWTPAVVDVWWLCE